jgi:hypothetical protein
MLLKSFWNAFVTKDSMNGIEPNSALKIHKFVLSSRKPRGGDTDKSNPYGDQVTHFIG